MNKANSILLKTMLPVIIGAGVVVWLFCREFSVEQWQSIPWNHAHFRSPAAGASLRDRA